MPEFDPARPVASLLVLYAHMVGHDASRYIIWSLAVWFIVWRLCRRALAGRKIRTARAEGAQMRREFATSLRTAAVFAMAGVALFVGDRMGVMRMQHDALQWGWGWFAASLALLIVLHDAWFYWTHRLIHDPRLFRLLHRTHHRSHNPTPFTAYSFDIGEAAINAAFVPLAAMLVPFSFPVLLMFMTHMIARNVIGHSGYELFPARRDGRPLFDWLTTVTHHDLHHAGAGWNFGLYFTWWDRLMGTEHPLYHERFAAAVRRPLDGSAVAALARPSDYPAAPGAGL